MGGSVIALFQKGQSGNPGGRPKTAAVLPAELTERYGDKATVLIDRLDKLSRSRTERIALEAAKALLAYACGNPTQAHELSGRLEHAPDLSLRGDVLARLTPEQLEVLGALNRLESGALLPSACDNDGEPDQA